MTDPMFAIEMLPAQQGDALWVEYGSRSAPRRLLIDAGTPPTHKAVRARMSEVSGPCHFELTVVTHIDTDHIGGMLKVINELSLSTSDFWFNYWDHLPGTDEGQLGVVDGEILNVLLRQSGFPWNGAFQGRAIQVPDDVDAPLPAIDLPDGLTLTVITPTSTELVDLRNEWAKVIKEEGLDGPDLEAGIAAAMRKKGIDPGTLGILGGGPPDVEQEAAVPFTPDPSVSNSSSIGFLAEFEGKSCLFSGDGAAPVIASGIARLLSERHQNVLEVDAYKVAHHGSKNNTDNELLELIDASKYLVSTSGAKYYHPDAPAISRVILDGHEPTIYFNYRSDESEVWDDAVLMKKHGYRAVYPDDSRDGFIRVEL